MPRHVAVIIPNLGLYGGNLRYLELGNELTRRGVDFTVATPEGTAPPYFDYRGRMATMDELRADPPEVLLASEQRIFPEFLEFPAGRRFFYFIIEKTAREKEIAEAGRAGRVTLLANSSGMRDRLARLYRADAVPVVGGVNPLTFRPPAGDEVERRPPDRFRVAANGRFSRRKKGTRLVVKAVHGLARRRGLRERLELVLFDTTTVDTRAGVPPDLKCRARLRLDRDVPRDRLRTFYGSADVFVSAEKKAGWSNPTIEAMACGCPVICTRSGTTDFAVHGETALVVPRTAWHVRRAIRRMMGDDALRRRLAAAGRERALAFTWERTAGRLLEAIGVAAPQRDPA
jgi:glycosyltransferase involved in cell wall biosynthesis